MSRARLFARCCSESWSDAESLAAYAYDASGLEGLPDVVVRPRSLDEVRRVLQAANQHRAPVVPRGAGTGLAGGAVLAGAVLLDLRGLRDVRVDVEARTVTAGAGASFADVQAALAPHGLKLPLTPLLPHATVGGLLAQNHVCAESVLFGDWTEVAVRVGCFDGVGRAASLEGGDLGRVVGGEGSLGIITEAVLRATPTNHAWSAEFAPARDVAEAFALGERFSRPGLLLLEYVDARCAGILGLGGAHVVAVYANTSGSVKDDRVERLVRGLRELPFALWDAQYYLPEEGSFDRDASARFIEACAAKEWPCHGHLGVGVLSAHVKSDAARAELWKTMMAAGGVVGGKHGYGRVRAAFVPEGRRKEVARLKESYDYNAVLNPGVLS